MDDEEGRLHLAEGPTSCVVPRLESVAKEQDTTCQKVFERAYLRERYSPSYARAAFARFLQAMTVNPALPPIVEEYCSRKIRNVRTFSRRKKDFCAGCMLNRQGVFALVRAYEMIHPEITDEALQAAPGKKSSLDAVDTAWQDLVDSGALEEQGEGWEDILRSDDQMGGGYGD